MRKAILCAALLAAPILGHAQGLEPYAFPAEVKAQCEQRWSHTYRRQARCIEQGTAAALQVYHTLHRSKPDSWAHRTALACLSDWGWHARTAEGGFDYEPVKWCIDGQVSAR